ncbi:hypothetical protein GYB59_24320 [bacterium]|nr:hypothetical protein [bacterium]
MVQYWCVNFDNQQCLEHGLKSSCWMMQYQYGDENGNLFQGSHNQKGSITKNWNRVKRFQVGDWLVAYLAKAKSPSGKSLFAIGRVSVPPSPAKHISSVDAYLTQKDSHGFDSGVIHYHDAPAFYEDFDDPWRANDGLSRYAQRVAVES